MAKKSTNALFIEHIEGCIVRAMDHLNYARYASAYNTLHDLVTEIREKMDKK